MNRVKMEGIRAYLRYTEAFNKNQPKRAPGFSSVEATAEHVESLMLGRQVRDNERLFSFMDNWLRVVEENSM